MSLNLQCARLNLRALYGLISAAKGLEAQASSSSSAVTVAGQSGR